MEFVECQTEEHPLISTNGLMYITHGWRTTYSEDSTRDTVYSIYIGHSGSADMYMDDIPSHEGCHRQIAKLLRNMGGTIVGPSKIASTI